MDSSRLKNLPIWLLIASAVLVFAALALLTAPGWFARLQADDYCAGGSMRQYGWLGGQVNSYQTWSGRVSATLFTYLFMLLAPGITRVLPFLTAGLWALALSALFRLRLTGTRGALPAALLLGGAGAFFSLLAAPSRYQVLFWLTGTSTYTFPLILLTVLAAVLAAELQRESTGPALRRTALLFALLAALAAAFSETNAALHTGFFALTLAGCAALLRGTVRRTSLRLSAAGLVGSLTGMVVLILAPGNAARMANQQVPPGFGELVSLSLRFAADFLLNTIRALPLPLLACLGLAALCGFLLAAPVSTRSIPWKALLLIPAAYLLVVCATAPSVYAQSAYPEGRAQLGSIFILISALLLAGLDLGAWLRAILPEKSWLPTVVAVILTAACLYPLRAAFVALPGQLDELRPAAEAWDARHAQIVKAAEGDAASVTVPALDSLAGLMELGSDPAGWVNQCAAQYYGFDRIQTTP